jgi:large subunit ribosomal protein L13
VQGTYVVREGEIVHHWYLVDADGVVLGRLASQVAAVLRGKHKATYTPWLDTGDHVVVINAARVRLTGRKLDQKLHYWHTGYPSGLRTISYRKFMDKDPAAVVRLAVRGMLPKTPLGRAMLGKLRVYPGAEHPHVAQSPEPLIVKG